MDDRQFFSAGPEEPVMISALNQYVYCPRRCALMHVEGVFEENQFTLEGSILHSRTDTPGVEERLGVRIVRALPLFSRKLGLTGKADIVEFQRGEDGTEVPYPVDYKRGRRRKWDNDDIQLCAQGLCLEEMIGVRVPAGAIFHATARRRREVPFTGELRSLTLRTIDEVRELVRARVIPAAVLLPKCDGCSLRGICMPEITSKPARVERFRNALFIPGTV